METVPALGTGVHGEVSAAIERWLADGIITPDQAARMRADLPAPDGQGVAGGGHAWRQTSAAARVTEALGYLGGVVIVVAVGLVAGSVWDDLSAVLRVGLVGTVTVVLLVAGGLIPTRLGATGDRLRSVLWLASSAAMAGLLGVGASEWSRWGEEGVATFTALGTAAYSAGLWRVHRHLLQHVAVFVPLLVAAATIVSSATDTQALPGLGVWALSAAWFALAWGGVLPDRQVGMFLGAAGAVIAAVTTLEEGWGVLMGLATVTAVVGLALLVRDLLLLGVGAIGTLIVLPPIMDRYFPGALAPALALLALGVLLVGAAVYTTRRRGDAAPVTQPGWATGTRRAGALAALAVVLAVSVVIAVAG